MAPASTTETFVALRTEVQNWRWAGVPFYLRTGKRLAERDAQIVVNFRRTPHTLFPGSNPPNKLVIKLQPEDGLELHLLAAKGAGQAEALAPVSLDLDFDKAFAANRVGAYERLLLDVIAGRLNLFVRSDEQEEAWRWVEPILDGWRRDDASPRPYAAGTWGPAAASAPSRATVTPGRKRSRGRVSTLDSAAEFKGHRRRALGVLRLAPFRESEPSCPHLIKDRRRDGSLSSPSSPSCSPPCPASCLRSHRRPGRRPWRRVMRSSCWSTKAGSRCRSRSGRCRARR